MSFRNKVATTALAFSIAIGGSAALANQDDLFMELEEAAQTVRELELKEPLDVEVVTREEHREIEMNALEDESATEDYADWNLLLQFLSFIDEDQDINEIYASFVSDQVLGLYDPETKQLVIISTNTEEWGAIDKSTFVHETVHALQDQNFDIMSVYGDQDYLYDDRFYAARSLIEGDASLAEIIYLTEYDLLDQIQDEYGDLESVSTDDIPFFLMESMSFYYDEGALFVMQLWQSGGWDTVNDAWVDPPTTSEQIIHPEKYVDGEGAVEVKINDPQPTFGGDWRVIEDNSWGELGTRIFIENGGVRSSAASDAAEGWGGDRVYVVTNDEESAMVWSTAWDSEDEADEFVEILKDSEAERIGLDEVTSEDGVTVLTGDGWTAEIHQDGEEVTYYLAETDESLSLAIESQENARERPMPEPDRDSIPSTPVSSMMRVAFWVREN